MAHEVVWSHSYNGFLRQLRAFMKDAPRVVRSNDHDDIQNLGVDYQLAAAAGARPAGDILHIAPETDATIDTYRLTCVKGTATAGAYQANINATVTWNSAARTIQATDSTDWSTSGVVAGDLIRIANAATAANNGIRRVLSITTTSTTNDTITLDTLDSVTNNDVGDVVDIRPITLGSVFDIRRDPASANVHVGWAMSAIEVLDKNSEVWYYMRDGGSWAVNDYAEFTLEEGAFSSRNEWEVSRTVDLNENGGAADTISRSDYNGNFLRDGFETGERVEIVGSAGEDGVYTIVTAAAKLLTLNIGDFTADELGVNVTLIPRQTVTVNFDPADVTFPGSPPTIVRSTGDWLERGYLPGGRIEISDAVDAQNNAIWTIDSIDTETSANDTLILVAGSGIAAETSDVITATPRNQNLLAWTEHRYIYGSGGTLTNSNDMSNGELPPVPDSNDNYNSEWIAIGPGDDPVNNPQTIYVGYQTQYDGTSRHNVEIRGFDAVSDISFGNLGNASPPTYIYLTRSPSMETFMTGDGAHMCGMMDVNTSVTEWFYTGFGNVHGTQAQHPRPMFIGGMGYQQTATRNTNDDRTRFFVRTLDRTGTTDVNDAKSDSGCWHRWVDGQWFSVAMYHQSNGTQLFGSTNNNTEMHTWPYGFSNTQAPTFPFDNGDQNFGGANGNQSRTGNPNSRMNTTLWMRASPTSITPGAENRVFPLIPVVALTVKPDYNIVLDFRNIYYVPGDSQATKNRIFQNGYTYIVGQNHEKTGQEDFAALRLA